MHAIWKGTVVADSDDTVVVEGNHYFPRESLRDEFFAPSRLRTLCFWKGVASYRSVTVDGAVSRAAAWEYKHPSPLARRIKGRTAFGGGVSVVPADASTPRPDDPAL